MASQQRRDLLLLLFGFWLGWFASLLWNELGPTRSGRFTTWFDPTNDRPTGSVRHTVSYPDGQVMGCVHTPGIPCEFCDP